MSELITVKHRPRTAVWILAIIIGFSIIVSVYGFIVTELFKYTTVTVSGDTSHAFLFRWTTNSIFTFVPHVMSILIVTTGLIILMVIINYKIKRADPLAKPKGLLLLAELFVTMIDNFTADTLGEKMKSFAPYLGVLAMYLFSANVFGLLGFTPPPTTNLSVTFSFGLTTFVLIRVYGLKYKGWGHITELASPWWLTPINIVGEFAVPISLSVRLFGNILSGAIIMTMVYGGLGVAFNAIINFLFHSNITILGEGIGDILAPFTGVPLFHLYFDLFAGLIQTFVFTLLTSVFIANKTID